MLIMLGLGLAMGMLPVGGCVAAGPSQGRISSHNGEPTSPGARPTAATDARVRGEAERELGPAIAQTLPPIDETPVRPVDPGAALLVESIARRLDERSGDAGADEDRAATRIALGRLRNQSRARSDEFDAFLTRFADLLTEAGQPHRLRFCTVTDDADYVVLGTAYLVTAGGFDQWELFLTISPADRAWTVWRPAGPIRVLRSERRHAQQIYLAPPRR